MGEAARNVDQAEAQYKQQVVEAARQRLLKAHAQALGGFLPKGVLSKPEDLELLAQFDTNNDGVLDKNERVAAERAFMKFDADGNGSLDETEKNTAMDALRAGGGSGFA